MADNLTIQTNRIKTTFIDTVRGLIEAGREDSIPCARFEAARQLAELKGENAILGHIEQVQELFEEWEREARR